MKQLIFFVCIFMLAVVPQALAQVSEGGTPASFGYQLGSEIDTVVMPEVDVEALLAEDAVENRMPDIPPRFAYPFPVDLGLDNAGTWEVLDDGRKIWRLRIESPGAHSLNIVYDRYWLPEGARFFVYSEDQRWVIGAFTENNNKSHGKFATAPVGGDAIILEYEEPANVDQPGEIHLEIVGHDYRNIFGWGRSLSNLRGFGDSDYCEVNVNCPEGEDWDDQARSVAVITLGGSRLCTGGLLNNALEDYTPYFLTANHCLGGEQSWVFVFNYKSPSCEDIDGPLTDTISGSSRVANNSASDFGLLVLDETPPAEYNIFYAGWSNTEDAPDTTVNIHHPNGDIMKISFDYDPAVTGSWPPNPTGFEWEVRFDVGTAEHGSSGSPLFDQDGRVVGQCHGNLDPAFNGDNYCEVPHVWYGKFCKSWDHGSSPSSRLKDWLDPEDSGIVVLDGRDPNRTAIFTGIVTNEDGEPIPGAEVTAMGERQYEILTDETGFYELGVRDGEYMIQATHFSYHDYESESMTIEIDEVITHDITMTHVPTGVLEGIVTDVGTGLPIEDAVVHLMDVPIADAITDEAGFYSFGDIRGDYEYDIHCQALSYGEQMTTVFNVAGETTTQNFALQIAQSFEFDDGNWTGTGEWEWGVPEESGGPPAAYEGTQCWGTDLDDEYNPLSNYNLITSPYQLTAAAPPYELNFYHWYETNDGWDGGNVSISTNGGDDWELIHPEGEYPDQSVVGLAGQPGYTGDSDGWQLATFDLIDYVGETVQFRFRFRSTNDEDYGWFIDFVTVLGQPGASGDASLNGMVEYRANEFPVINTDLTLSGEEGSYTTTSDVTGHYTFNEIPIGNYTLTPAKTGDVNGIGTFDAAYVAQYSANIIDLPEYAVLAADVSGNDRVNIYDAALIAQYASQMDVDCLCGEWRFVPAERVYQPLVGNLPHQDFIAILYGEVTDNWSPPEQAEWRGKDSYVETRGDHAPVQMTTDSGKSILKTTVTDVIAFQFILETDVPLTAQLPANVDANWQLIVNQISENRWFVGGYGMNPLSSTELLEIETADVNLISGLVNEMPALVEKSGAVASVPQAVTLFQNYPNPFNPITTIRFDLPQPASVSLKIYDVDGKLVQTLVKDDLNAGVHQVRWDGLNDAGQAVESGLYFYQLDTDGFSDTKQMILLK